MGTRGSIRLAKLGGQRSNPSHQPSASLAFLYSLSENSTCSRGHQAATREGCERHLEGYDLTELRGYVSEVSGKVLCCVLVISWLAHALRVRTSLCNSRDEQLGSGVLLRASAFTLSCGRRRHSKGRRWQGAWWHTGLGTGGGSDNPAGYPHIPVRPLRRFL